MEKTVFIDFEEGQKYLASDHLTFLKRFFELDLNVSITSLNESYAKKDWIELKRNAHSLKGTSAYIGALTCKGLAETLQLTCMESAINPEKVARDLKKLLEHLEALDKYLRVFFNGENPPKRKASESRLENPPIEEHKQEGSRILIKKLTPPVSRSGVQEQKYNNEENDFDAYEEINKQWRCLML